MKASATVISIGAVCFGIAIGYVTYRTLVRKAEAAISDLAAVVAAVGGGVVAGRFDIQGTDTFAWYSIGLLAGMAVFLILRLVFERGKAEGKPGPIILGD